MKGSIIRPTPNPFPPQHSIPPSNVTSCGIYAQFLGYTAEREFERNNNVYKPRVCVANDTSLPRVFPVNANH